MEAGFSSQNGDRAWVYTGEQRSVVHFFFVGERIQCKGYSKRNVFCLLLEVFVAWTSSALMVDVLLMKRLKRKCGSGRDNSRKTPVLRVSTHWYNEETSVSMLVEDMSINICFFPSRFEYHMFYVSYTFGTYLLTALFSCVFFFFFLEKLHSSGL
jgi:hypothetical protein